MQFIAGTITALVGTILIAVCSQSYSGPLILGVGVCIIFIGGIIVGSS